MIGEIITCSREGCDVVFSKKTHNQLYHEDECTRLATNGNIKRKYHQRKAQRLGLVRDCAVCEKPLSRYNSDIVCSSCSLKREVERNQSVLAMLANVTWQS